MRALGLMLLGVLALGAAFLLGQRLKRDDAQPPALASVSAPAPAAPAVVALPAPATVPPPPAPPPPAAAAVVAPRPAVPPSFDHVRVSATGDMVIAGRAEPEAEVTILFGSDVLGVVRADLRGEWVLIPARPISTGNRELSLRALGRDGTLRDGQAPVLVLVPERRPVARPLAAPSAPAQEAGALAPVPEVADVPTVIALPRDLAELPRVLQAPTVVVPPVERLAEPPAPAPLPMPAAPAQVALSPPSPAPAAQAGLVVPARPAPAAEPAPAVPPAPTAAPAPAVAAPVAAVQQAAPPAARGSVSLQVVDYDEQGEVRFAGTAPPGAPVRLYVNNAPVGEARAGTDGRWTVSPEAPVAAGLHQLRVDQLTGGGQVAARIEAPFQRAEIPPEMLREGQIVVQPGQNLWRIARSAYGRGVRFTVIYEANRGLIRDPRLIYPGQVFALPSALN